MNDLFDTQYLLIFIINDQNNHCSFSKKIIIVNDLFDNLGISLDFGLGSKNKKKVANLFN